jgi:hypothetical protein
MNEDWDYLVDKDGYGVFMPFRPDMLNMNMDPTTYDPAGRYILTINWTNRVVNYDHPPPDKRD